MDVATVEILPTYTMQLLNMTRCMEATALGCCSMLLHVILFHVVTSLDRRVSLVTLRCVCALAGWCMWWERNTAAILLFQCYRQRETSSGG